MTDFDSTILLTTGDLRRMDDEIVAADREISDLEGLLVNKKSEREKLLSRRRMVNELLVALGKSVPETDESQLATSSVAIPPARSYSVRAGRLDVGGVTWMSEISRLLSDEAEGMTYEDLRAGIDLGPLAERLKQSDKGLYGGVAKLEARGELIKHNGRLFAPQRHADFIRRVAAGEVEDITPLSQVMRPSPMADTILSLIRSRPEGMEGGEIIDELKHNSQFAEVVSKNNSSAYNVLKRLIDRNQIRKDGKSYFLVSEHEAPENNSGADDGRS